MLLKSIFVFFFLISFVSFTKCVSYEDNVVFTVYNEESNSSFVWKKDTSLTSEGCNVNEKFAIVTHGWEGSKGEWVPKLIVKLLKYRGGCVIFFNWGEYSDDFNYNLVALIYWRRIADVLTRRLKALENEGVSPDNIFMYGHSLGARISIEAGLKFGMNRISQIDACDSAGPGFMIYDIFHDPKNAAKNVQCIHTTVIIGTSNYNCHQDWLLGDCGKIQPADNTLSWLFCRFAGYCPKPDESQTSHNLCNDFYISAFDNDFIADNHFNCSNVLNTNDLPTKFKMGYLETRRKVAKCNSDDDNFIFTTYVSNYSFKWQKNTSLITQGCDVNGKFAFVTHGMTHSKAAWVLKLIENLLQYRGGCVIFVNWAIYSDSIIPFINIPSVYYNWQKVADALASRLFQLESEGVSPDNIFMYGHSFGARISIQAGLTFGKNKIAQIDACDSVGFGFWSYDSSHDPKDAAKNVQCIHTSPVVGTTVYNCHQDWLMGKCGLYQPGENFLAWFLSFLGLIPRSFDKESSHTLCNIFYISAFENDFVADNHYKCNNVLNASDLPPNFKMGYQETRRSSAIVGMIASSTSKHYPYNVV